MRRALDAALAGSRAAPVRDLAAERAKRGFLRDAWEYARWRYEQSATVRRFTLASIGVHAAAAAVLVALLARSSGTRDTPAEIHWRMDETATLPDGTRPADPLPRFEAMSADGVETAEAPGVRFPNRASAERWAAAMTIEGRRGAFRVALGADADRAAGSLDRGLEWLAAQRGSDGSWGGGADPVETTAVAVMAFAGAGRSSADDPALGLSVDWLAQRAESAAETGDRALAARALAAQFVADFGRIPGADRVRRAGAVGKAARAVASVQNSDGGFGSRPGARSDVASTVAAVAALADVRTAGVDDTGSALRSAARWLEIRRSPDGRLSGPSAGDAVTLTSALAESAADAGLHPLSEHVASSLQARVPGLAATPRDAAQGAGALAALRRPTGDTIRAVVEAQRADGRWASSRWDGAPANDVADTAWGVVALTRAFRR
jgi:hypothetical protein